MHEIALMAGVFEVMEKALSQKEVKRVLQVKLKIGELTNAEPEALLMAFEAFGKDTIYEGAELLVERTPIRGHCRNCLMEFNVKTLIFCCPRCGDTHIRVIQGQELLIESLEVE